MLHLIPIECPVVARLLDEPWFREAFAELEAAMMALVQHGFSGRIETTWGSVDVHP